MKKIRAAVVGLGRIGSLLEGDPKREKPCTHAGAIAALPNCILAAGADAVPERRRLFAERWGVPVYADAEEMLAREKPALLSIATHPDSHYRYCALAARYGLKAAVCEKPLAPTLAEAKKIAALEKAGKIAIVVNHERRFSADYIKAKKILDGGRLGALLSVRAALYMGRGRRLLDVLWHDGTHLADAAMFLSGCTLKHRASFGAPLEGRKGTAWLEGALVPEKKAAGIPFVMEIGAGRDHLVFELEFSCERGRLRIGNGIFEAWESAESPYAAGFRSLAKTEEGFAGPTGYFVNMMKDAARCAQQNARAKKIFLHSQSNSLDGLKVIVYLNAVRSWTG